MKFSQYGFCSNSQEDNLRTQGQAPYLYRATGLLHFVINVKELPGELVHFDGVLEGVPQKLIIMSHLRVGQVFINIKGTTEESTQAESFKAC